MHACLTWYMTSFQSSPVRIWKTVSMATEKESKLVGGLPSGKLKVPPKSWGAIQSSHKKHHEKCHEISMILFTVLFGVRDIFRDIFRDLIESRPCMPSSAAMRMKRKRRSSSEMMDFIEETSDTSRLRREDQYLEETGMISTL